MYHLRQIKQISVPLPTLLWNLCQQKAGHVINSILCSSMCFKLAAYMCVCVCVCVYPVTPEWIYFFLSN